MKKMIGAKEEEIKERNKEILYELSEESKNDSQEEQLIEKHN